MERMDAAEPAPDWRRDIEQLAPAVLAWSHARLHGRPTADAEDLTQEVLCRAVALIDRFAGDNLTAWVFSIGKHVLLEHLRRRRRAARIRLPEGHSSAYEAMGQIADDMTTLTRKVANREDLQALLRMIGELDAEDRTLAILCGMEGAGSRAAAVQLGINEDAAQKRWRRLRTKLAAAAPWLAS